MASTTDFLVIGGGVIGLNLSIRLKQNYKQSRVVLIDKESSCGIHSSGRNSGVLHAGFYYTADSLKAKFTRDGNRMLTEYCLEHNIRINRCGKLVVAKDETELNGLDELLERGRKNGVELQQVTEKEAKEIEPRVRTCERALFSPTTSVINPSEVIASMVGGAKNSGVDIQTDTMYLKPMPDGILTNRGPVAAGYVINASGLYADKIALDFGFSKDYRILPFKGLYLYANENSEPLHTNIYPVPNLRNPFLGVHYTLTVDGRVKIGPTAIPAFWREHYNGFSNFSYTELMEILLREFVLFTRNDFGFRSLAFKEIQKYYKPKLIKLASSMISGVEKGNYRHWGRAGIRAQLINIRKRKLEMDFRHEGDGRSFHVLNAVSPAFTCAMPFTDYLISQIENLSGRKCD